MDKRTFSSGLAKYAINPFAKLVAGYIPGWALLETTGRRTGNPVRNPVGDGLRGSTFWIVAEHGSRSHYVRNILANPRVRIRARGRWRTGTARVLAEDDPRERQRRLGGLNAAFVRLMGTDLLTIRVDLDA
ncbi:nitroreductase family deazaflavin-dependent oxidoreductase [soil metagenome]